MVRGLHQQQMLISSSLLLFDLGFVFDRVGILLDFGLVIHRFKELVESALTSTCKTRGCSAKGKQPQATTSRDALQHEQRHLAPHDALLLGMWCELLSDARSHVAWLLCAICQCGLALNFFAGVVSKENGKAASAL